MAKGWTEERRRAAAERCRQNKPWEKSTGPRTKRGKMSSSMNAYKHGGRSRRIKLAKDIFRHTRGSLKAFNEYMILFRTRPEAMLMSNKVIESTIISEHYKDKKFFEKQTDKNRV